MDRFFKQKPGKGIAIQLPQDRIDIIVNKIVGEDRARTGMFDIYHNNRTKQISRDYSQGLLPVMPEVYLGVQNISAGPLLPVHYQFPQGRHFSLVARSLYFQEPNSGVSIETNQETLDILLLSTLGEDGFRRAEFAIRREQSNTEMQVSCTQGFVQIIPGIQMMIRTVKKESTLPMCYIIDSDFHLTWVTYDPKTLNTTAVAP